MVLKEGLTEVVFLVSKALGVVLTFVLAAIEVPLRDFEVAISLISGDA